MDPDERAFRSDVDGDPFKVGVALGYWKLISITWPKVLIAVTAAERDASPDEVVLNFHLAGYPNDAPTATPWNVETDSALVADRLPAGRRASSIFRRDGWNGGNGLYAPYDRLAMKGHENWARGHSHLWWKHDYDITFYLRNVYVVLHDEDYTGV